MFIFKVISFQHLLLGLDILFKLMFLIDNDEKSSKKMFYMSNLSNYKYAIIVLSYVHKSPSPKCALIIQIKQPEYGGPP